MTETVALARTFAALADPTRLSLLILLAEGEATVGDLAKPFELSQQAVSKHLKVLETAGFVSRRVAAQTRPCRLEPDGFDPALLWLAEQRQMWASRHDRLEEHLMQLSRSVTNTESGSQDD